MRRLVALGAVVLCAGLILLLRPAPQARLSAWVPAARALSANLQPVAAELQPVALTVIFSPGLYDPGTRADMQAAIEQALRYTTARFGATPRATITAEVQNEPGCGLAGLAFTDVRVVHVSTCGALAPGRAVAILAHEFVHQLAHDYYGDAHLHSDLLLNEGLATWGAGEYWLSGQPDFRGFVRTHIPPGSRYPLATHYSGLGINAMNTLYYEWASFVEFLLQTYGRERFDALYVTGAGNPGTADYAGVYGKDLPVLEAEWLAWLDQP